MIAGRFSGIPHCTYLLPSCNLHSFRDFNGIKMSIAGLVSISVVHDNLIAIPSELICYLLYHTVSGNIYGGAFSRGKILTAMAFRTSIDRILPQSESTRKPEIALGSHKRRHVRHTRYHISFIKRHFIYFIKRTASYVYTFGKDIQPAH